jgi:hypothetical protein
MKTHNFKSVLTKSILKSETVSPLPYLSFRWGKVKNPKLLRKPNLPYCPTFSSIPFYILKLLLIPDIYCLLFSIYFYILYIYRVGRVVVYKKGKLLGKLVPYLVPYLWKLPYLSRAEIVKTQNYWRKSKTFLKQCEV